VWIIQLLPMFLSDMDKDRQKAKQLLKGVQKSFGMPKTHFDSGPGEDLDSIIGRSMVGKRTLRRGKGKPSQWAGWD
jgi:hypothetical protein